MWQSRDTKSPNRRLQLPSFCSLFVPRSLHPPPPPHPSMFDLLCVWCMHTIHTRLSVHGAPGHPYVSLHTLQCHFSTGAAWIGSKSLLKCSFRCVPVRRSIFIPIRLLWMCDSCMRKWKCSIVWRSSMTMTLIVHIIRVNTEHVCSTVRFHRYDIRQIQAAYVCLCVVIITDCVCIGWPLFISNAAWNHDSESFVTENKPLNVIVIISPASMKSI